MSDGEAILFVERLQAHSFGFVTGKHEGCIGLGLLLSHSVLRWQLTVSYTKLGGVLGGESF